MDIVKNNDINTQTLSPKLSVDTSFAKDADIDLKKDIKITSPGVWIVVSAICVVLVGFIIWCSLYDIETTKQSFAYQAHDNKIYCLINVDYGEYLQINKYNRVYIDGKPYCLDTESADVYSGYFKFSNDEDDILIRGVVEQGIDIDDGDKYYIVPVKDINLSASIASAYVVIDMETPISFLFNYKWGS